MSLIDAENTEGSVQTPNADSALTGGMLSFDELSSLMDSSAQPNAETEQKTEEPAKEAQEAQATDPKDPGATEEKLDPKLETKEPEKKDLDKQADKVKNYKVKSGESEVQLRGDAMLEVPVAGKPEKVSFQDLLNNYAGKTDWTRKYTEFDKERQTFKKDRTEVEGVINDFLTSAPENPMVAISKLGEHAGYDMPKFWKDFRSQLDTLMEDRMKLSPEERKARDLETEVEFYKKRDESQKATAVRERSLAEEKQKVERLQETHGLDNETFYKLYQELKESGEVQDKDLTADLVVEYHKELDARKSIQGLLKEVSPNLKNSSKAVSELREVMISHPKLSIADLKEIAIEVYGDKTAKNLSRKVQKSEPNNTAQPSKARRENPISFDELFE